MYKIIKFVIISMVVFTSSVSINTVLANNDIVLLRKDCSNVNPSQQCFTDIEDVETWLWATRQPAPSSASPVTVSIAPGTYIGTVDCTDNGYVSFIGSGVKKTILKGRANAIVGNNCNEITFQDMTISNGGNYPINWMNGGSSRWINVDVIGPNRAWHDEAGSQGCPANPVHYWYNSRLSANGLDGVVYESDCGESWFYGSELTFIGGGIQVGSVAVSQGTIIAADESAVIRVFGSVLRGIIEEGKQAFGSSVKGVVLKGDSNFHMHGGIISINQSTGVGINVDALVNHGSGIIHTPETAFSLKAGSGGAVSRIINTGTGSVKSPFQWPANVELPSVNSQTGSDIFIETDCDATGVCTGVPIVQQQPHMMIFSSNCTANGPWFDIATNTCRK